jgi:hypothetical protein
MMPLVYAGAGLALALLLFVQVRMSRRLAAAAESADRLEKALRDLSLDLRARIEEAVRDTERQDGLWKRAEARVDAVEERLGLVTPMLEEAKAARTTAADARRASDERLAALEATVAAGAERADAHLREVAQAADARASEQDARLAALVTRVHDLESLHARLVASLPRPGAAPGSAAPAAATPPPAPLTRPTALSAPAAVAPPPRPNGTAHAPPPSSATPSSAPAPSSSGVPSSSWPASSSDAAPVRSAHTPEVRTAAGTPHRGGARAFVVVLLVLAAAMVLVGWLR